MFLLNLDNIYLGKVKLIKNELTVSGSENTVSLDLVVGEEGS